MDRAYSLLELKSVDDDARLIEGLATTPEVDRVGDIVESAGAKFRLPLPLLWQHQADSPIGQVLSAKVTKAGIQITAQIAKVAGLPEVDRAWQLIKAGLVRGLSIGFKGLDVEPLDPKNPWGGQRFKSWEWLELSAVTIPANATASIATIKSLDTATRAASGTGAGGRIPSSPAVAGGVRKTATMTISEQVTAAQTDLRAKSERLTKLMELDGQDGGLEDAQIVERDTLTGEVTKLSSKVESLKALESAQAAVARPAIVRASVVDPREPTAPVIRMGDGPEKKLPPGIEFARYIICRMAALKTGMSPLEIARQRYPDLPRIQMLLKEAVPAGSTQDATYAEPLVYAQNLVSEFIEYLRPMTILGRIDGFTRVPFNVRITGQTSGASGYWVGEGRAKPLTKFDVNAVTLGWAKVANIAVITDELARFSNPAAETLVRNELAKACQERLDIDFIDPAKTASAGVSPASITNGITNLNSSGVTLDAVDVDVQAMMSAFINAKIMPTHWIMPQTVALSLSLMRNSMGNYAFPTVNMNGGTFFGLPVVTSQYAILGTPANNLIILLSAPDIFLSDDGSFSIDVSREASLEMDDAPTMSSGPLGSPSGAVGSVVVSMFQTNSMAIRCERFINWARRRDAGVVWMDDVQWAAGTQ